MIREAIAAVAAGRDLTEEEAAAAMEDLMTGEATPAQVGAFLTALRIKGECVDEISVRPRKPIRKQRPEVRLGERVWPPVSRQ